nr:hypothetical protein [Tanacetum cinerariifolium]GEX87529.1 hypothetical protein [Tanacetum cinerariifolium]
MIVVELSKAMIVNQQFNALNKYESYRLGLLKKSLRGSFRQNVKSNMVDVAALFKDSASHSMHLISYIEKIFKSTIHIKTNQFHNLPPVSKLTNLVNKTSKDIIELVGLVTMVIDFMDSIPTPAGVDIAGEKNKQLKVTREDTAQPDQSKTEEIKSLVLESEINDTLESQGIGSSFSLTMVVYSEAEPEMKETKRLAALKETTDKSEKALKRMMQADRVA